MSNIIENFIGIFNISIGAIIGANIRFRFLEIWSKRINRSSYGVATINIISTFLFGLFLSIYSNKIIDFQGFKLFFFVGVFGSMSTFSTFIFDLFKLLKTKSIVDFLLLLLITLFLGIAFAHLGLKLGNIIFQIEF